MFHLIVTCVNGKTIEGPSIRDTIQASSNDNYPNNIDYLYNQWKKNLINRINKNETRKAFDLYQGGMWSASIKAYDTINEPKKLWVISCGYGFINADQNISGYKATFGSAKPDSIFKIDYNYFTQSKLIVHKSWWDKLIEQPIIQTENPTSIHELVNNAKSEDIILICAGNDYYEAIYNDLLEIRNTCPRIVIVGIQKRGDNNFIPDLPPNLVQFIKPYRDRDELMNQLKDTFGSCNRTQLHPKSAQYLIKSYNDTGRFDHMLPA